uniref:Uncharacterized protein n=1 Tax=Vespula pensylvanica TaxID=30213 RepID=A0A834JU69_VESPE|nr:hypothetical protein H0235_017071 [Vespula pensylvanica]
MGTISPGVQFVSGQKRVGLQITSNIKEQKHLGEREKFSQILWMLHLKTISPGNINPGTRIRVRVCNKRPDLPVSMRIPIHLYEMMLDKIPGAQGHDMFTDQH